MPLSFRPLFASALALAAALASGQVLAAKPVAYAAENGFGQSDALLIELKNSGTRAVVVTPLGRGQGAVSTVAGFQVVTLDTPYTEEQDGPIADCDGLPTRVRHDTTQVGTRLRSGTANKGLSELSYAGTDTTLDGCDAGKVVSWGGFVAGQGTNTIHRNLAQIPGLADLVPGSTLAGLSADPGTVVNNQLGADLATFGSGSLSFARSGATVPYTVNADGWIVMSLPTGAQRGYLRLALADNRGMEQWLSADMLGGVPQNLWSPQMMKPVAGTAWGAGAANARIWESAIFAKSTFPFFFYLYKDGTGERVSKDLVAGTESRAPLSAWTVDGSGALVTERTTGGSLLRRRTWQPLALNGKAMGVLESETGYFPDGSTVVIIPPRVNAYIDQGKAVKPAVKQAARQATQSLRSPSSSRSLSR
ncbi:hypothetical protein KAK07_11415 [Ideonella sp. 4Y16]|uniref:hypothetical protein n=1 Tax=Ideonella alba TaxID=2824118 RepID=UPI001B35B542|nr:hypothetical protein [Ideonella alba]MBQ0943943.1 hypothetical protein [Ideonella alba]